MNRRAIQNKLTRLRRGGAPRVLDLFAGCGGLSLGFQASGCKIAAAVEFDPDAARSHGFNFHKGDARHSVPRDITATTPTALCTDLDLGEPAAAFDIVIGGPPCQAFARVGRSKLREVADHPEAFRHDPRARLYIEYLDYVAACAPLAVVLENVPDMLNHGGHNIAEEICEVLESRGYVCGYTLLNSAFYGVPQMRERMFLIALHGALGAAVAFPEPIRPFEAASMRGDRPLSSAALTSLWFRKCSNTDSRAPARTAILKVGPREVRRGVRCSCIAPLPGGLDDSLSKHVGDSPGCRLWSKWSGEESNLAAMLRHMISARVP